MMEIVLKKVLPAPLPVSDRQFFQGLFERGHITFNEYIAAVGPGTMPASLLFLVGALPVTDLERQRALGILTGATVFERTNPLAPTIGQLYGWDSDALDEFWRFCVTL